MDWVTSTLFWYVHLFVIGIIFMPLTKRLFSRFFDHGYVFSKTLGIILITYSSFILGMLKIVPFTQITLYGIVAVFAGINLYLYLKDKERGSFVFGQYSKQIIFIFEEVLFLGAILLHAYLRGQEPSIHGLEKFMDFGFINSILRSTHFPPLDMWYSAGPSLVASQAQSTGGVSQLIEGPNNAAGFPINYYYFGHLSGAMLIKLTGIPSFIGYNIILSSIFAQGITLAFSLIFNIIHFAQFTAQKTVSKLSKFPHFAAYVFGLLGSYILNLGGNLHTIYLFTKGYPNDTPTPFWTIFSSFNPTKYWYPNATRFIPFTIHEFPSYSYVVADLHGHVFDIPFVLLTLAVLFHTFYTHFVAGPFEQPVKTSRSKKLQNSAATFEFIKLTVLSWKSLLTVFIGFMCAVHYMTNAFDGPIYMLLSAAVLFFIYRVSYTFLIQLTLLGLSYLIFALPFTLHFSLFVTGIGVNCPPSFIFNSSAVQSTVLKTGPFLFEKGNCQKSEFWMMFVLWGFFWINFLMLLIIKLKDGIKIKWNSGLLKALIYPKGWEFDFFMILLFCFSTFLIIIPEFFYVKDIYPAHFRANTMFKLGYQAFIMMSIASTYVLYRIKVLASDHSRLTKLLALIVFAVYLVIFQSTTSPVSPEIPSKHLEFLLFIPLLFLIVLVVWYRNEKNAILGFIFTYIAANILTFVCIYPFFSFPSYYTNLQKTNAQKQQEQDSTSLDGQAWLQRQYPDDLEIISYINKNIIGQPVILEAQGDSYTDYERISAYTGTPTIAGWWVHEWLWRGSADIVGKRIPDITNIYESDDIALTKQLLQKYHVKYVVISESEHNKYSKLNSAKFDRIGKKIFQADNGIGALYQVD